MSKNFKSSKYGVRYYYKNNRTFYFIEDNDNILQHHEAYKKDFKYCYYECSKGYEASLTGLQQYRIDFNKDVAELQQEKVQYLNYETHEKAIMSIFKSKATNAIKSNKIEPVDYTEFTYQERCSNGGLISIDPRILNKEIDCYGYDVKGYYPYLLGKSNLQIPTKKGNEIKLDNLTFPLQYGYYKVQIKYEHSDKCLNNPNFYKIFAFSSENVYTHYSLNFVNELNQECAEKDRIKMILNTEDEYNAYVFDKECLINVSRIFKTWYEYIMKLKSKFPTNKLIKRFSSSLWGSLTKFKRIFYSNDDEYFDLDLSEIHEWEKQTQYKLLKQCEYNDDKWSFEVLNIDDLFETDVSRLKSFLTSYARITMSK